MPVDRKLTHERGQVSWGGERTFFSFSEGCVVLEKQSGPGRGKEKSLSNARRERAALKVSG